MNESNNINVNSIESMGLLDGPGVRVVVFLQGCALRCIYCHNPETWDIGVQNRIYSPKELAGKIIRYKNYIKNGGVTFSGGEPLLQSKQLIPCLKILQQNNIHICLDTAGIGSYDSKILDYVDLILLDVKGIGQDFTTISGGKFEQFLQFVDVIQKKKKPLWIRQVIMPNYNDSKEHMDKLYNFLKDIKYIENIELLPYHNMAIKKYKQLNIDYKLIDMPNMDKQNCKSLENELKQKLNIK